MNESICLGYCTFGDNGKEISDKGDNEEDKKNSTEEEKQSTRDMQFKSGLGTEKRTRDRGQGNGTGDRGQRKGEHGM